MTATDAPARPRPHRAAAPAPQPAAVPGAELRLPMTYATWWYW